jgi:hypothetical protein
MWDVKLVDISGIKIGKNLRGEDNELQPSRMRLLETHTTYSEWSETSKSFTSTASHLLLYGMPCSRPGWFPSQWDTTNFCLHSF